MPAAAEDPHMLYKVTPTMAPAEVKAPTPEGGKPRGPRKRRKSAVFDADGNEVLISLTCLKCRNLKPLVQFGLRKMGDGAIRNQPWCRGCRSGAGTKGKKPEAGQVVVPEAATAPVVGLPESEEATPLEAQAPDLATPVQAPAAVAPVAAAPVTSPTPGAGPVSTKPVAAESTSPWLAAIASLRAVVGRPTAPDAERSAPSRDGTDDPAA